MKGKIKNNKIMIKRKLYITLWLLLILNISYGQNDSISNKYLSIGSKTSGICFGNSNRYNGLRFNLWDKGFNVEDKISERINGINISFSTESKIANGIQVGGLVSNSSKINGLSIVTISHNAEKINGFATSFIINSDTLNGVFVGFGIAAIEPTIPNKVINGLAAGIIAVGAEKVKGATICLFSCYSKEHYGLSIAAYNKTENLYGLQIGLLNYVGNNPKLLRWLPLINFHL
jgi:hypothetical protein